MKVTAELQKTLIERVSRQLNLLWGVTPLCIGVENDTEELFEDAVLRTDGFPDKPAPDALLALMERNGLKPEECAMVGDRDIDIDAGHNAGMSGVMFDPDGFYAAHPAEIRARTMEELCRKLMG